MKLITAIYTKRCRRVYWHELHNCMWTLWCHSNTHMLSWVDVNLHDPQSKANDRQMIKIGRFYPMIFCRRQYRPIFITW